ncbi:hypothetical protein LTR16_001372 [Cryomyces antarcticus]|uniref:Uncharacterized protein n=1 Tax=Cryomyces antarcticus TaxID=329879 RepID=A0ABR0KU06_9PEZI|nr:hypothetical protein LTR39_002050 [Cryomyces antarcticus]KAK5017359.1 hypothetical protein LTR60_001971 [Cryomyces antarcticus]KAK5130667.1 hypothetical protein LTR16_001372 [Cryomyces antarcticus]
MFCASLRRRPSITSILSTLSSPSGLALRETTLSTHDIAFPLPLRAPQPPNPASPPRHLLVLLLTPSTHFASLTGGTDITIVFLLDAASAPIPGPAKAPHPTSAPGSTPPPRSNPAFVSAKSLLAHTTTTTATTTPTPPPLNGIHAYTTLAAALFAPDLPTIPLVPLAQLVGLPALLRRYVDGISSSLARTAMLTGPKVRAEELLALCTTRPPLGRQAVFVVTDLFADLRSVAAAAAPVPAAGTLGEFSRGYAAGADGGTFPRHLYSSEADVEMGEAGGYGGQMGWEVRVCEETRTRV